MTKFHVNSAGEAGPCAATKGGCPFGGEADHFTSPEAARESYESKMSGASLTSLEKHARKDDKFELDYRDESGSGYAIEKNSSGKYRWVWSEPDGTQEEGSMGSWVSTPAKALRAGAADWELNGGDYSKKYSGTMRGAATKLEKKETQTIAKAELAADKLEQNEKTSQTLRDMEESYAEYEEGDVSPEVAEEIETAIAAMKSGDRVSAWWALDRATQAPGYDERGVSSYIDAYRDEISSDGPPTA